MKYALAALALAATALGQSSDSYGVSASNSVIYSTEETTQYTTAYPSTVLYTSCPESTSAPPWYPDEPSSWSSDEPSWSSGDSYAPATPTWTYSNPLTVSWAAGYAAPPGYAALGSGTGGYAQPPAATTSLVAANGAASIKVGAFLFGAVVGAVALVL